MNLTVSRRVLVRFMLGVLALVVSAACSSSSGCSGCAMEKIPGGFPLQKKYDNVVQVRLSQGGINFVENNFEGLIKGLVPGGLDFVIPKSCGASQKICCTGPACKASLTLGKSGCSTCGVTMTPTPKSSLALKLKAKVKTTKLKVEMKILLLGWVGCDMTYDSATTSPPHIGLNANVDFVVQASNANKLAIKMNSSTLSDFQVKDAKLSGKWYCTAGDFIKNLPLISGLVKKEIEKQLKSTLAETMNGMLKTFPMGQEGRMDVASFMSTFSPTTTGKLDMFMWAGGHAKAENSGMSIGVMGGFQPAKHNSCVLYRDPPAKVAIPWSKTFTGNMRPDGKPFHVGIGVNHLALDAAAWAMYSSGAMCLDVGTDTVPQISSSMFALLLNSVNDITTKNEPMLLAIRPRYAPTVELKKGTYTVGKDGKPVIKEPLLNLLAKDFAIDLMIQVDHRMVRLFTIVTDLKVPALLYADSKGNLQPMLGDLKSALTNIRLENYELIAEDPKKVTSLLPTLIALASGSISSAFEPIALPSVQGLKLILDGGSITSVDKNSKGSYDNLAIFAKLGMATSKTPPAPSPSMDTEAVIESLKVPPTAGFRVGPGFDPWKGPKVVLRVNARAPAELAGRSVEYAYRVDGGFYRPWTTATRLEIQDPSFWLQGKHTVEVMSRAAGEHLTIDPTPVKVPVIIDTVAPRVRLTRQAGGLKATVDDMVAANGEVLLSWSINGGPFGSYGTQRTIVVSEGTTVAVRARDTAGNVGLTTTALMTTYQPGEPELHEAGGCSMGGGASAGLTLLLLAALGLVALRRREQ